MFVKTPKNETKNRQEFKHIALQTELYERYRREYELAREKTNSDFFARVLDVYQIHKTS